MKSKNNYQQHLKDKDNQSFMNKFKDKHSIISKQGLLKLFDKQIKKEAKPHKSLIDKNSFEINLKSLEKNIQKQKVEEIIKARSQRKASDVSVTKSLQLPYIKPSLPRIQKSTSTTINLRQKFNSSPLGLPLQVQTQPGSKQMKKVASLDLKKQRQHIDSFNFELDKFAIDHLNFLDKFQQRMKKREGGSY